MTTGWGRAAIGPPGGHGASPDWSRRARELREVRERLYTDTERETPRQGWLPLRGEAVEQAGGVDGWGVWGRYGTDDPDPYHGMTSQEWHEHVYGWDD